MSKHRNDNDIKELKTYFTTVIEWINTTFKTVQKEMCGLEWGRLYEAYGKKSYALNEINAEIDRLYDDPCVKNRKGIWEYVLGGCTDKRLLDIRIFDEKTKRDVYNKQTENAKKNSHSNCPLCAVGDNANKNKIWTLKEMEADHVTAWSKGGLTGAENCEMLCMIHNRAKGNR
jgi:hypothetical protein